MKQPLFLLLAIILIVAAIIYLQGQRPRAARSPGSQPPPAPLIMDKTEKSKKYTAAPELLNLASFINTDKISLTELVGKQVILVDFWTYSCINCLRTTPYLNSWQEKYGQQGLTIIGVHTPEFEFEKKYENVARAVKQYGIKYPVVLDNDYATWYAFKNRYWPRKYLIDIDGFIVYDHIGEGGYEETEKKIQELLTERALRLGLKEKITGEMTEPAGAEISEAASPEIYFGATRNTYLGNGRSNQVGRQSLKEPTGLKTNILYLVGEWNFNDEFASNVSAAKIIFRYSAKSVYFVGSAGRPVTVKILRDGKPVQATDAAGTDVTAASTVSIGESRLYKLIEDTETGEHTLEIIIDQPGLEAFTFTFG